MERLLARLERRLGKFAIPNLTHFIVGGMAIVFVLTMFRPEFASLLTLDLGAVERGEVWRLVTYLFIPPGSSTFWVLISLYWTWWIGSLLDTEWGAFKFNVYYLLGMVATTCAAFISGRAVGNSYINLSLTFAFATLAPNYEIYLYFILRVKLKWVALFLAAFEVFHMLTMGWPERAAIVVSVGNYFAFFGGHLWGLLRQRNVQVRQAARRTAMQAPPLPAEQTMGGRSCAICGAREQDDVDIRVCSCERCGGKPRTLCLMHAKNH
ncbi:MAG TPA: rhomboid family intramembrane serine protease [Polyangiaceae bacterium]|nr:rhomboid family intramembrane serine protease [Polyangiaceae bacterium]